MDNTRELDKVLSSIYYNPSNPGSFSTERKLFDEAKLTLPYLTHDDVENWLKKQLTYNLHKDARRNFLRNRVIVSDIDEQWMADLVDMQEFRTVNKGNSYILTVIDIFSKFAWAIPIKRKTGLEVRKAFEKIFNESKRYPMKLQTDQGKEFLNKDVKNLFNDFNINQFATSNTKIKCSVVERFNRTLKARMFKYFTANGTRRYIDILPKLVEAYNRSYHSAIGKRPAYVRESDKSEIMYKLYGVLSKRELLKKEAKRKEKSNIDVGDTVRTAYELKPAFDKAYYPNWSDEILEVKQKIQKTPRITYKLEGSKRAYYPEEVQKAGDDDFYRVEKVINKRKRNGKIEYKVKWVGYPASYNSWIQEDQLVNLKRKINQ